MELSKEKALWAYLNQKWQHVFIHQKNQLKTQHISPQLL